MPRVTQPKKSSAPMGAGGRRTPPPDSFWFRIFVWGIISMTLFYLYKVGANSSTVESGPQEISYSQLSQWVTAEEGPKILKAVQTENVIRGETEDGKRFIVNISENDPDLTKLMREKIADFRIEVPRTFVWNFLLNILGPFLLLGLFWFLMMRGAGGQGGGRILSFGRSRAKQADPEAKKVTFDDVAGVNEAKEELQEVVEFLKDPRRFQRLGGRIPKGVLLLGPPGCGKTLLAKAVAGEADVPFFSISGSDFVEMFVGVGASRVRDLFEQAKKTSKVSGRGAIIFIDEIDAVGRQRFAGIGGGHDEREQTLNALLVEMDGFDTQEAIILMAATNRPDVLDPALLRPGRFDRQIVVDRPDLVGREQILKVHIRKLKLDPAVDLRAIARQTPGFSGADLANLCNEAALLAARRGKDSVTMIEMEEAIERVMAGPERKSRVISPYEKSVVACHEAGHALVSMMVPGSDPLQKVSIIPRGVAALGYTLQTPTEDRYLMTRKELLGRLTVLLGGRTAEELTFSEITTGAQNDLQVATDLARRMVCEYGMSDRLGTPTYGKRESMAFLGHNPMEDRNYSEETAQAIDQEVRRLVEEAHERARSILTEHKARLKRLADTLLEKEVLDGDEAKRIVMSDEPVPPVAPAEGQANQPLAG